MRLRSQKTVTGCSETPRINRRRSNKPTPKRTRLSGTESPLQSTREETVGDDLHQSDDEIPTLTRRPLPRGRLRKRAIAVDDREADLAFKTPIRPIMQHERILSEIDPVTPRNATARNIYSPIVRFLTPSKENVKCAGTKVLMSPEQGVFGYGSIDLLAGDEEEEVFDPFRFIKNIPSQSQHSRPQLRDIPPKTRSTPEATLVVDLEETLMFSSLNVIDAHCCPLKYVHIGHTCGCSLALVSSEMHLRDWNILGNGRARSISRKRAGGNIITRMENTHYVTKLLETNTGP